jgi:hypothetical protein
MPKVECWFERSETMSSELERRIRGLWVRFLTELEHMLCTMPLLV